MFTMKLSYILTLVCNLLVLTVNTSFQLDFDCGRPQNCSCVPSEGGYKIECPKNQFLEIHDINIRVYPRKSISFKCNNNYSDIDLTWLKGIQFGQTTQLNFRDCLLSNTTLEDLTRIFTINGITTLRVNSINNNITTYFDRKFFKGLVNITDLELIGLGLKVLPTDFFKDMDKLTKLDLQDNNLEMSTTLFSTVPHLVRLELGMNNINHIQPGVFQHLKQLELLNLWGNKLRNLTRESFTGLHSLTSLDLSSNGITSLQGDVFADLGSMKNLSLNGNNFTSLPSGLFNGMPFLEVIKLHNNYNHLSSIPSGLLGNITVLKEVYMDNCNISQLPEDIFWGSQNITVIHLSNNAIVYLPELIFRDAYNLIQLDIRYNKLVTLPDKIFSSLGKLRVLKLGHNRLTIIPRTLFEGLSELEDLDLEDNGLNDIHADAFRSTQNLKHLYLKNNYLSFISKDATFQVEYPYGSWSPLQYCSNLEVLELSNNSISEVFADWCIVHKNMRKLDLSYNKIRYVQTADLQFFSDKLTVNLSHNNISSINLETAESLVNGQEELSIEQERDVVVQLEGNPLRCDCTIYHLLKYLNNRLNSNVYKLVKLEPGSLTCASPEEMSGLVVRNLDSRTLACRLHGQNPLNECPKSCLCFVRREDRTLLVDCSNAKLREVPNSLPDLSYLSSTELNLSNNFLDTLPEKLPKGYIKISKLILSHNRITELNNSSLPPHLKELYIDNNNLTHLNASMLEFLTNRTKLTLHSNPWDCNCSTLDFLHFLQISFKQVELLNNVTCRDGRSLARLITKDICPIVTSAVVAISVTIAVLGVIVGVLAALYYRYQSGIKVWLYAHNMCLWFVTEEELDKDKLYDAFVSYSHKDEDFIVNKLVPGLENGPTQFKLCLHYRDWIAGEWIPNQIVRSVEESRRTLVVLSPSFIESVWGRMEFRAAHSQALSEGRARVILVLYGDIGPTDDLDAELQAYLSMNTYVKWGDPWFWDKLRYALPHPPKINKGMLLNKRGGQFSNSLDDRLELVNPSTPPTVTTPPAEIHTNPLEITNCFVSNGNTKIMLETNGHTNGMIKSV